MSCASVAGAELGAVFGCCPWQISHGAREWGAVLLSGSAKRLQLSGARAKPIHQSVVLKPTALGCWGSAGSLLPEAGVFPTHLLTRQPAGRWKTW